MRRHNHGANSQNWREKCIICDQEVDCVGDTAQEVIEPSSLLRHTSEENQDTHFQRNDATFVLVRHLRKLKSPPHILR